MHFEFFLPQEVTINLTDYLSIISIISAIISIVAMIYCIGFKLGKLTTELKGAREDIGELNSKMDGFYNRIGDLTSRTDHLYIIQSLGSMVSRGRNPGSDGSAQSNPGKSEKSFTQLLGAARDVGFKVESIEITEELDGKIISKVQNIEGLKPNREYTISSSVKSGSLGDLPIRFKVKFRIDEENLVKMDSVEVIDKISSNLENLFTGYASVVASTILHLLQMIIH